MTIGDRASSKRQPRILIYAFISLTIKQNGKKYTSFDVMVTWYPEIQDSRYDYKK